MLYKDKLTDIRNILKPEIERLFSLAISKQKHDGDLLLFVLNGFYNEKIKEFNNDYINYKPYAIGLGVHGHSEQTHNTFIDNYRKNYIHPQKSIEYSEWLKNEPFNSDKNKEIEIKTAEEAISVQLEMLIYIKIWESDYFIKKLYEFIKILKSENYDWHFKITESKKDKEGYGARHKIIREDIRDSIKDLSPKIYNLINETYFSQIRNAIAHSTYFIIGRSIVFNNNEPDLDSSIFSSMSFDEWGKIIHNTLILHNELNVLERLILSHYDKEASKSDGICRILVTEKDNTNYELKLKKSDSNLYDWRFTN
jgi:hypothetical protein